jgi:hypothetical protein
MLNLHLAIEGAGFGGGLKIDVDALPPDLLTKLSNGKVSLDDPAVTLELLKLNAVIGVTGLFEAMQNKISSD